MSLPNQPLYTTTPPSRPCQCFALRAEMIRMRYDEATPPNLIAEQIGSDGNWFRVSLTEFAFFSGPLNTRSLEQRPPEPSRHVPHDKPDSSP